MRILLKKEVESKKTSKEIVAEEKLQKMTKKIRHNAMPT
jgi:hypothetical protein